MKITRRQLKKIISESALLFEESMQYPDIEQVENASESQLAYWHKMLPNPKSKTDNEVLALIEDRLDPDYSLNESSMSSLIKDAIFSSKNGGMKVDFGNGNDEIKLIGRDGAVFTAKILKRIQ